MNHFDAVQTMHKMAEKILKSNSYSSDFETGGTMMEGGRDVSAEFQSGQSKLEIFWDAAWQHFKVLTRINC